MTTQQRFLDYRAWHHAQVETDDIDPVYPVLRTLAEDWGLSQEQRAWLCICHVTYYDIGSALTVFRRYESAAELPLDPGPDLLTLPTATERRAHRDQRQLARHLAELRTVLSAGPYAWLGANGWDWPTLNKRIMELHGNGRWAAYKLAEMLQKVALAPTFATDAGHAHSSGPRKGLADLYEDLPSGNSAGDVRELDALTEGLRRWVGEDDVAQVETSLCDFHGLVKGSYYLGHDIDKMEQQLLSPRVDAGADVWEARQVVFDHSLLGENNDWSGIRRHLKREYRDNGVVDATRRTA